MTILPAAQIATLAKAAGWSGEDVVTAVAVALAESGGNPRALADDSDDLSYGLWQINMLGGMGPERRRAFGLTSNEQLYDPATNARAAHAIWRGQGWQRGWGAYSSGAYRKHLPAARAAVGAPAPVPGKSPTPPAPSGSSGVSGDQGGLVDALLGVNQSIKSIASTVLSGGKVADALLTLFLPSNMLRLFMGLAGTVFIMLGIAMLGREVRN